MQNKILKLVRRSQCIDLGSISRFLETDVDSLFTPLSELIAEGKIEKDRINYKYINQEQRACLNDSGKPDIYQFHDKKIIMQILACFCSNVTSKQAAFVLSVNRGSVDKFYKHFKQEIFNLQKNELLYYFKKSPKIGRERVFEDKLIYLYLYGGHLYVSDYRLGRDSLVDFSEDDRLQIKNLYKRAYKKKNNHIYKTYYHQYIAEQIWRCDKNDEQLFEELYEILAQFIK